ncbi:unnamed protein product, partial [Choristocarpus tenellus]
IERFNHISVRVCLAAAVAGVLPVCSFHVSPIAKGASSRIMAQVPRTLEWARAYPLSLTGTSALFLSSGAGEQKLKVLVPIAEGSEEIEGVTVMDTLVRAGAAVTVASVGSSLQSHHSLYRTWGIVTCSRGVKLIADCMVEECKGTDWDAVVCPGGMPGATNLKESTHLEAILRDQHARSKVIAAICASPAVVLAAHGLLDQKKATCYPAEAFTGKLADRSTEPVVVDGNIITSQGPATSLAFALKVSINPCRCWCWG